MEFIRKILLIWFVVCRAELFASSAGSPASRNLILYKYEGNFYPMYATETTSPHPVQDSPIRLDIRPVQLSHQIYHDDTEEEPVSPAVRPLGGEVRFEDKMTSSAQQEMPTQPDSVTRQYHDIFLKLKSPHELVFGHVLNWPESAEKKVETRTRNKYKGQVIWADPKGGYGEHYWDLAQGAL